MLQRKLLPNMAKRYCSIQSCINFKGSCTGEYTFFRPPPDRCTHDKWKEAIGEHQQIRHISLLCELHFKPQDVMHVDNNKRRKLKTGSIPCIFVPQPNAVKIEPTIRHVEPKITNVKTTQQHSNGNESIHQTTDAQELQHKLELQIRLTEYWKAVALKYEPNHADPKWYVGHTEKVTTELLEAPPPPLPPPPSNKVFKPYQCGTCNECFEKPRELEWHVQKHTIAKIQPNETFQKCIVCSEYLYENETNQIDRHRCTHQRQIVCEHCNKGYTATSRLLKHLNAAHKDRLIYKCDRCQQTFGMNLLLTIHNEAHDREDTETQNRFKCSACSIVFSLSSNLENHQKYHCTFIKSANSQLCELCGMDFQHIDDLKQHMQQHNDFECRACARFFKTKFSLKKHYERHHGSSTTATSDGMQMDIKYENS